MQSAWYSIKIIAVQKRPEALGLIAICSPVGFQNTELMCRVLGVSRQGYYHYRRNIEAKLADPEHQDILDYISMFYNRYRLHSYLGCKSLNQYEMEMKKSRKVA